MLYSGFARKTCEGRNAEWCEENCNHKFQNCPASFCQCTESEEPTVVQAVVQDKGDANFGLFITALPLSPDCVITDPIWSQCTKSCGGGQQTRDRRVISWPTGNGLLCSSSSNGEIFRNENKTVWFRETRACNTHPCPGEPISEQTAINSEQIIF